MNWLRVQMALLDTASALVAFAANWLLQSALLIVVGLSIAWLTRRRGAALHSAIYRTTLAAAVVCPLATFLLSLNGVSGWSLPMPDSWVYKEPPESPPETPGEIDALAPLRASTPTHVDLAGATGVPWDQRRGQRGSGELWPASPAPAPLADTAPMPSGGAESADMPAPEVSELAKTPAIGLPTAAIEVFTFGYVALMIALAWLLGATFLMARLALAWRRLRRLCRAAAPAESAIQEACHQAAVLVGVESPVVLRSPYVTSPCLASLWCGRPARWPASLWCGRPARKQSRRDACTTNAHAFILLPEITSSLPLRDVLIHELAHLRRGDAGWNLLARLAEALFFFQPLLWLLSRRLEAAAEDVCDDYVVQFGGDRSQYARGLLEIAELSTTPVGVAAVAMVSLRSILARRITRILDPSRSLSTRAGNLLLALVIAGGLLGATVVGFVGLGSHPPAVAEPVAEAEPVPEAAARSQAASADDKDVSEPSEPAAEAENEGDKSQPAGGKEIRGTIVGADGKPVAGAKLYWIRARVHDIAPQPPRLLATTGEDGGYRFIEPSPVEPSLPASWDYMDRIVITAPGHGFVFTFADALRGGMAPPDGILAALAGLLAGRRSGVTRLPAAGEPIRGRLIDVNGQPIAGATVRIRWFNGENDRGFQGDLEARGAKDAFWQARAMNLLNVIEPVQLREVLSSATTDASGRFELRDIGPKKLVQLLVQGKGIEATEIVARNEPGEKIEVDAKWLGPDASVTIHPNEFVYAVGPSKPVAGRVYDLDTGEPIAGAVVRTFVVHNQPIMTSREREQFAATTDEQGRYRIAGLPTGKGNKLVAFATGNIAYVPVARTADTSPGDAAAKVDFRLNRGIWAEGRVFDAESQKPFTGEISFYLFRNRELEEAIPGLRDAFLDGRYWTNANGEFRVPMPSSRGILAFRYAGSSMNRDGIDRFARGFGADEIAGSEKFGGGKWFPTLPHYLIPENYERIAEASPTAGQETIHVDMPLFASPPLTVRAEANGEGVTNFEAYGNERWEWQQHEGPEFEIQDLRPGERRKVFVFQRQRNLAGGGFVEYGAKQAVRIELVKAGSVKGRLLDADGEPIDDATLVVDYEKLRSADNTAIWARHPNLAASPTKIPVDKDGRFRLDGLIPGWSYHAYASAPRLIDGQRRDMFIGRALQGVQVAAGEVKDLGDVVVGGDQTGTDGAKSATSTKPADQKTCRGQVLDPAGRPFAGAKVYALGHFYSPEVKRLPLGEAESGANGQFELSYPNPIYTRAAQLGRMSGTTQVIAAVADGFGPGFISTEAIGDKPLTLHLVRDDVPIAGRVLDLEGRPVAGAKVKVLDVQSARGDDLSAWIEAIKKGELNWAAAKYLESLLPEHELPGARPIVTDAAGRYRVTGIGRERKARLLFSGPGIASTEVDVVTRRMPTLKMLTRSFDQQTRPVFGADLDLTTAPTQAIVGTVRDAITGKPLAGVTVANNNWLPGVVGSRLVRTTTDKDGRYRLEGLPKMEGIELLAIPGDDEPLFMQEASVPQSPTLQPATVDFDLHRGIWISGRVTDKATGEPVPALVHYFPFLDNEFARKRTPEFGDENLPKMVHGAMYHDRYATAADGSYRLVGLPGRAIIGVDSPARPYRTGVGAGQIAGGPDEQGRFPTYYNNLPPGVKWPQALKEIDPPADAQSFTCDLELDPGESVRVAVTDADGKPLSGYIVLDNSGSGGGDVRGEPNFDALNLGPDETRTLLLLHAPTKLGKVFQLRLNDHPRRSMTVRLEPFATLKGRLVNADGDGIAGATITANIEPRGDFSPSLVPVTTDADGRFEYGLPTGCGYTLYVEAGGKLGNLARDLKLASGEQKDLGDVVFREDRGDGNADANVADTTLASRAIRGRILSLEGRPVVGATVRITDAWQPVAADGNLDEWIAAAREAPDGAQFREAMQDLLREIPREPARIEQTSTDDKGRFEINGAGAERVVRLRIDGKGIESVICFAVPRRMEPLRVAAHLPDVAAGMLDPADDVELYGLEFERVVAPGCEIEGIVRDDETDQPLPGITVLAERRSGDFEPLFRATTDAQGRYRLSGVSAREKPTSVVAIAPRNAIHIGKLMHAELARPGDAAIANFSLARGVWLDGRVFDKVTGRGVEATVSYHAWTENPHTKRWGEYISAATWKATRSSTDREGRFRLLVLPGGGLVSAQCSGGYARRVGAEKLGSDESIRGRTQPNLRLLDCNSVVEVEIAEKAQVFHCDIPLDPGRERRGTVLGPDGESLEGAHFIAGWKEGWIGDKRLDGARFTVEQLVPGRERTLVLLHEARRLIGALDVSGDGGEPLQVRLEPWSGVRGRLVDEEGHPLSGLPLSASDYLRKAKVGDDGRFELDRLVPGRKYDFYAKYGEVSIRAAKDVILASGEFRDLGDLTLSDAAGAAIKTRAKSSDNQKAHRSAVSAADADKGTKPEQEKDRGRGAISTALRLSGRVFDDAGKPIVGARVRVYRNYWSSAAGTVGAAPTSQWLADTRSDASGRFSAEFEPLSAAAESHARSRGFFESMGVFATANGFGFGLKQVEPAAKEQVELRLPRDSHPIEGRVLDLEGRAVQGARVVVRAVGILDGEPDGLDDWLARVRAGAARKDGVTELPNGVMTIQFDSFLNPFPAATTDAAGRFTIASVGADRVAYLTIEGAKVAGAWLPVVTRLIEPLPLASGLLRFSTQTCYGARCDIVVPPEQPIRGVVRDAETGQPLKGVEVGFNFNDDFFQASGISATTGTDGRYELPGLAKPFGEREEIELRVMPAAGQAYFRTKVKVPRRPGLDAVICDLPLRKAVILRGKVTDRETGEAVRAAVRYYPLLSNAEARRYVNFEPGVRKIGADDRHATGADGRFAVPAIAGRGVLTVVAERGDRYTLADGADALADVRLADQNKLNVYHLAGLNQDNAYRDVNIPAGSSEFTLDVELAPLPVTRLLLVDEGGEELSGVETQGLAPMNPFADRWSHTWRDPLATSGAELIGPQTGETRETLFLARTQNLGALIRFTSADTAVPEKRIVLRSCGSLRGRIVDSRGKPVAGAWVNATVTPGEDTAVPGFAWRLIVNQTAADANGRFELKGVPSGARYSVEAYADKRTERWRTATAEIKPGEAVELGDVVYGAVANQNPRSSANVKPTGKPTGDKMKEEQKLTIRGRVLLPDGKPAAGADLYWARIASTQPRSGMKVDKRGATDADGRFQLELTPTDLPATPVPISLVAHKMGFGVAWREIARDATPRDVTLKLVKDLPIHGRVIDTEGRPVAGARVSVSGLLASRDESLDAFLLAWKHDWRFSWTKLDQAGGLLAPLGASLSVQTDKQGQFELSGVGIERVATLDIEAASYAYDQLQVITRQDFDPRPYNDAARSLMRAPPAPWRGMIAELTGPKFEHIVTAELVVRGKVVGDDQKPVAGASVSLGSFGYAPMISAVTDAAGRYELHGQPRGVWVGLDVNAPEAAELLGRLVQRPTTPTQSTVEINVELKRGVVLKGRVTDRTTGKAVRAGLRFVPLADNTFVDDDGNADPSAATNDAGEFRMLVMPGPGVLMAQALDGPRMEGKFVNQYRQASFSQADSKRVPTTIDGDDRYFTGRGSSEFLMTENAVKFLELKPDAGPATCDLAFDPGKTVKLTIEDGAGQPVTDVLISGIEDLAGTIRLAAPSCTILAVGPDRPRRVCILHPERRLAAAITLTGNEAGPVKVRLAASASISGRAFAPDGQPLPDALVQINYARRNASDLEHSLNLERAAQKTDGEGRFHVDNIVPGEQFSLDFKLNGTFYRAPVIPLVWDRRVLDAGQKLELGDVRVR